MRQLRTTLLRYARSLLDGHPDEVEDVVQEALAQVVARGASIASPEAFGMAVVRNQCYQAHQRRGREVQWELQPVAPAPDRLETGELLVRAAAFFQLAVHDVGRRSPETGIVVASEVDVDAGLVEQLLGFYAGVVQALPQVNRSRLVRNVASVMDRARQRCAVYLACSAETDGRPLPPPRRHDHDTLRRWGALLALRLCRDLSEHEAQRLADRVLRQQGVDCSDLQLVYLVEDDFEEQGLIDVERVLGDLVRAGEDADLWVHVDVSSDRQLVLYVEEGVLRGALPADGFLRGADRLRLDERERLVLLGWSGQGRDLARCWEPGADLRRVAQDVLETSRVLTGETELDLELELAA